MGNRLSGLWCKKTTLNISNKSEQKESPSPADKTKRIRRKSSGSGTGSGGDGSRGTFRFGSARRLSLTKDSHKKASDTGIATVEQTYRELIQAPIHIAAESSNMKVNPQLLPPAVKVSAERNGMEWNGIRCGIPQLCHDLNGKTNWKPNPN
ncbi:Hypothetical predicted protein [Drosophila guanche]|uniref:Uncharacterized protein n=1 Tax=Drosophila guanche TaxID=7266 RepID=A0A3B0KMY0_DROGU|nr:Hypothetical predicted protein [Drosophila guanche]